MSHKNRRPQDHMCGEKMCWNCEEFVDPETHLCYMKPIRIEEEKDGQQEKQKTKTKTS